MIEIVLKTIWQTLQVIFLFVVCPLTIQHLYNMHSDIGIVGIVFILSIVASLIIVRVKEFILKMEETK